MATCILLAVLLGSFCLEERVRGQVQWQRYEKEAKARGVKLYFVDFIPPKVPDSENFASVPIFEACRRAIDAGQDAPNPFELPKSTMGGRPEGSDADRENLVNLVAWQVYFFQTKMLPVIGHDAPADVLKALGAFADPLKQLSEAGQRPHCRFPIHWEKGPAAELPQFTLLQAATRLYALRLHAHLAMGDHAAACTDFQEATATLRAIRREPGLIAGMVRISMGAMIKNAVWDGLARRRWTDADLRLINAELSRLDWLDDDLFSMASERGASNANIDMMISGRSNRVGFYTKEVVPNGSLPSLFAAWFYLNKLRVNLFFDELAKRADPAQHRWHGEYFIANARRSSSGPVDRARYAFSDLITSKLEEVEARFARAAVMTDEARLACALERFRQARGEFPQTLGELAPEFIDQLPMDVVNGEPYHYRPTKDGNFVLYSVGSNLRDDGGKMDPNVSSSKQLDWVWRYPAK